MSDLRIEDDAKWLHLGVGNSKRVHHAIDVIAIQTIQYAIQIHPKWQDTKCHEPGGGCSCDCTDVCTMRSFLRWLRETVEDD